MVKLQVQTNIVHICGFWYSIQISVMYFENIYTSHVCV
jgi:hypothetical protein